MLAGVLLHMIAPAAWVDLTSDFRAGLDLFWGNFEVMDNATVFRVGDLGDSQVFISSRDDSCVVDLAAAGRIEGRLIEDQGRFWAFRDFPNLGLEVVEEGVVVVEALRHGDTSISPQRNFDR